MELKTLIVVGLLAVLGATAFFISQGAFNPAPEMRTASEARMAETMEADLSLYERLGGVDAIRAVVADFAQRLFDDPELDPFFGSLNAQRQQRFIDLNVDFLCQAAGGPCVYTGRSMFDAHRGLGTTNDIFNLVGQHLRDTLAQFNVPSRERGEILALIETTRDDIVEE